MEFSVNNVLPCSSVSDHEMIIYDFCAKAEKIINRTRTAYIYHEVDLVGLKNLLQRAYLNFRIQVSSMNTETQLVFQK